MQQLSSKLPKVGTTIFSVMSALAEENNAINLSQGFPDFECDPKLINLVGEEMRKGHNQYAPMAGVMQLRERIAEKVESLYNAYYDPEKEVTITAGGTQALFTVISAIIHSGDEVIIFEPAYDSYEPSVTLLGGVVKPIILKPPAYKINWKEVEKAISAKTKMIIINSPKNPTATILKQEDINELIRLTKDTNIIILSDEVYEHIIFDDRPHLSMARFKELREKSFIVASFGKLFHNTGWKVGYCIAPEWLMKEFRKVHQYLVFSVNTPVQYAIARYLEDEQTYLGLAAFFQGKRDFFASLLKLTKFQLLLCEGSYFQSVIYNDITDETDVEFAKRLTKEIGVASIPTSVFYSKGNDYKTLRFCFAKKKETLEKAVERLMEVQ